MPAPRPASDRHIVLRLPRHTLKIAGIAFAVGLLLFLLVWATGRKDNFYKPSSAQPTAGAPADDTIAPLPAPCRPRTVAATCRRPNRRPTPRPWWMPRHPPRPRRRCRKMQRRVRLEARRRPKHRSPVAIARCRSRARCGHPATRRCRIASRRCRRRGGAGGRGRYRQSRRRHTGAAQRLARSGPRGHGSGPALALPSCATQWSAGGRQHGHPIRVQTCAVSAAKPSCTAARASTRGRPSQVSPASANAA